MREYTVDSLLETLPKEIRFNEKTYKRTLSITADDQFKITYTCGELDLGLTGMNRYLIAARFELYRKLVHNRLMPLRKAKR